MTRLLILGAGPLQVPVIQRARSLGLHVIAADRDSMAVGALHADEFVPVDISDIGSSVQLARKANIDGVLTAATDYGVLSAAEISNDLNLPGLSVRVAEIVKNKGETRRLLSGQERPGRCGHWVTQDVAEVQSLAALFTFPLMVKPVDGSGSAGIARADTLEEVVSACALAIEASKSGKALIETFFQGKEYGVECFVHEGIPKILAVLEKDMTQPPNYAELGHSTCEDSQTIKRVEAAAENAIQSLGINDGAVNMDVLVGSDRIEVIDIGARMGGNLIGSHIVPMSTGIDHITNIIRGALGRTPLYPEKSYKVPVASKILALTPGRVVKLPAFAQIENRFEVDVISRLRVGDVIEEYKSNLHGQGYVIASGKSISACKSRASTALKSIDRGICREQ